MLKLMKYEIIKQKTSKLILAALAAILEVVFLISVFAGKDVLWAMASGGLVILAIITFVIVGLEEIITYYHDLRDKSGYMLFMTPYNVFTIMGSKILTGIVSIVAAAVVFGGLLFLDTAIAFAKYGAIQQFATGIQMFAANVFDIEVNGLLVVYSIMYTVFGWIGMVTSAFLAITLCMTIFSGMRAKGLISFVIYWVINLAYEAVVVKIANWIDISSATGLAGYMGILTVIFAGLCYVATGYLLNKELSL